MNSCKPRNVVLLVTGFLCLFATAFGQDPTPQLRPAPYFILPTWDGKIIKSSGLRGKVVLLDFFQTWCPDCQKSTRGLVKLYQKYKDQGFVVIGISHDREGAKVVEPFVKEYEIPYPVLIGDLSIAISYLGVSREQPQFRIPYLILIDRDGNIAGRYEEGKNPEATDLDLLEESVKKMLASRSGQP